ncbi:putative vitamin K epoxide reductase, Thioredoxin-like superfamily, VKOR domain superfamily [Helianthus annuus]|nr:putative vitamin K epoxide reductase, Thioredoxin-like superfamily, VKOR domain superfamily [Helianthus annuus]
MATFTCLLSSPYSSAIFSHPKRHRLHHHPLPYSPSQLKSDWGCGRRVLVRVKCSNEPSDDGVEAETGLRSSGSGLGSGISSYSWCAGLGGLGFLETSYLSYLKFTGSDAFCPVGGGSCGDVLNSSYAAVFGIPLPFIGMVAYGAAAFLALKLAAKDLPFGIDESNGGLILLGTTTSMATASAYFLYILNTQFAEASCSYCLASVLLSFSLFFTTAKSLGWQKIREEVGLQLCIAGLVFAALSNSYSASALPPPTRFGEKFLPYSPTEIKAPSSPLALKLAAHLRSVGAKMYGAFWCSHCLEQKEMFGQEAAKMLDYGECYPDGFKIGTPLSQECKEVKIRGFPMWVIKGQVLEGIQEFPALAKASGFEAGEFSGELAELAKLSAEANMQP